MTDGQLMPEEGTATPDITEDTTFITYQGLVQ